MELMAKQKREREARKAAKEAASSSKKKTSSILKVKSNKDSALFNKPDGTPRKSRKTKINIKSNKDSALFNKPDGTPRKSRKIKINIKSNKDSALFNKPDGTPRWKNTKVTPSKSKGKGGGVTINGKPPTSIQKKLLAGGWSAKELEAKINARKKKK